jgi:teichoic acid transport system permease protein
VHKSWPTARTPAQQPLQDDGTLRRLGVRPPLSAYLRSVWRMRDFILALPVSQLRSRDANTALGSFWHLLNPLVLAATYYLVFGVLFDARDDVDNYVGFLITGLFVFYYSQKCLTGGAGTILQNAAIIRSINLPRAAFPIGSVVAETLSHGSALATLLAILLVTGEDMGPTWLLVLPALLLQIGFNLGLAFWVGRLTFYFRDMQNLLPYVTRLLLYLSGVFFTAVRVPEGALRTLFDLNPLQVFISLNRSILLDHSVDLNTWAAAGVWAVFSLVSGFVFFWWRENSYGRG